MKIDRLDHVGLVVNDFEAAKEFFVHFGMEVQGEAAMEGKWLDPLVRLEGVRTRFAFLQVPGGQATIELIQFLSPVDATAEEAPANRPGYRHVAFAVDDIETALARLVEKGGVPFGPVFDYEGIWKLVNVRGPEGIIVELAQRTG